MMRFGSPILRILLIAVSVCFGYKRIKSENRKYDSIVVKRDNYSFNFNKVNVIKSCMLSAILMIIYLLIVFKITAVPLG